VRCAIVPLLRFLLAQCAGWAIVLLLLKLGLPLRGAPLAFGQGLLAAAAAHLLRAERWWLPAHLLFTPFIWLASHWSISPLWYLGAFLLLAVFYWTSFRTRVPLFLSNPATVDALDRLLPDHSIQLLDAGAGTGSALRPLARRHPASLFVGIEAAPGPWLIGWLMSRALPNLVWRRGDFWAHDWAPYDAVYVFLSPVPMHMVWEKARREMRPGSQLISNSFPIESVTPTEQIEAGGRVLFVYDPGGKTAE
jgi:hypothetical protein